MTGAWLPSLVGGYVYGFSSYELGQMLGHLHLVPVFLLPAAVHLVFLRMDGAIGMRRFVVLMAAVFALQVLISTEVLFAGLIFGFTALLVALWLVPAPRKAIRSMIRRCSVAGPAAGLVLSPFLYEAFRGLGAPPSLDWHAATARMFSADPLNYVVPTPITWLGGGWAEPLREFSTVNGGLTGVYLESGRLHRTPAAGAGRLVPGPYLGRGASRVALASSRLSSSRRRAPSPHRPAARPGRSRLPPEEMVPVGGLRAPPGVRPPPPPAGFACSSR